MFESTAARFAVVMTNITVDAVKKFCRPRITSDDRALFGFTSMLMIVFSVRSPLDKCVVDGCLYILGKVFVSLRFDNYPCCRSKWFHKSFSSIHLICVLSSQRHVCPSYPLKCVYVAIGPIHTTASFFLYGTKNNIVPH